MDQPLVSCLMVTRNRAELSARAIEGFARQSWHNKELVIIDDGDEDYSPIIARYEGLPIRYLRIPDDPNEKLGALRNRSLDEAKGEFCIQWDDDEWYHRDRILVQMQPLLSGRYDACVLRRTLMHVEQAPFEGHPFRTGLLFGTPGTVCHRKTKLRYPNDRKGEDSVFLRHFRVRGRLRVLDDSHSHLFMRCYHGNNTWDLTHFRERLEKGPKNKLIQLRLKVLGRPMTDHPLFDLTPMERATVSEFFEFEEARLAG